MTKATLILEDLPDGSLTVNGSTDAPMAVSRANACASYIAENFQEIHDAALKAWLNKAYAAQDEAMHTHDKHGDPYPVLNANAAHKGDDAECEVCQ